MAPRAPSVNVVDGSGGVTKVSISVLVAAAKDVVCMCLDGTAAGTVTKVSDEFPRVKGRGRLWEGSDARSWSRIGASSS
jgi:predicted RNA methylase